MYVPKSFEEQSTAVLHQHMRDNPFAMWVAHVDGSMAVNHIPFLLDTTKGSLGTLFGHVARANPVWRNMLPNTESVVVFQGPDRYITPSWYPGKRAHGKVVPTWNYAVAHARGTPQLREDEDWLLKHVSALSDFHESGFEQPWRVTDAPQPYIDGLLGAIVGIEIPIDSLTGKWKTGQNRPLEDKRGMIAGLEATGDEEAIRLAEMIARHVRGDG